MTTLHCCKNRRGESLFRLIILLVTPIKRPYQNKNDKIGHGEFNILNRNIKKFIENNTSCRFVRYTVITHCHELTVRSFVDRIESSE